MGSLGLRPIRTSSRYQSFGALQEDLDAKRAEIAHIKSQMSLEQHDNTDRSWQGRSQDKGEQLIR